MNNVNPTTFPDPNTDPRKKDELWILQYANAVWNNWTTGMPIGSIFYSKVLRYNEIREYALGRQSINKYKKQLLPDETADESWTKIDWGVPQDLVVFRKIIKSIVQKSGYNVVATPIDPQAKDAQDEEYAKLRAKIMMREALQQQNPQLADHPLLKKLPGEPADSEELQMQADYSPKFIRSKDAEEAVQLVFYENDFDKLMDQVDEDLVDFGVGGYWEELDQNNKVVLHKILPKNFGCSFTRKPDFSDLTWFFEIVSMKASDLIQYFPEEKVQELINMNLGKNGNPTTMGIGNLNNNGYDQFKFDVMCLRFVTWNKRVTKEDKDENGNMKISKTKPSNEKKQSTENTKYISKSVEVKYVCKWVIGTDMIFEFGPDKNQPRTVNPATMSKTHLGLHIFAPNFDEMRAQGITESLIPIADDIAMLTYKMRHFVNRMVAAGFDIDLAALEDSSMIGAGGQKMKPMEVLDFFFETGIFVGRRPTGIDNNINYKAIAPISNSMANDLAQMWTSLQNHRQRFRDFTGTNELTDGSTPNPKTLASVAGMAQESTNNAVYDIITARKRIVSSTAKGVIMKLQIALKKGAYGGYNKTSNKWITIPKSLIDFDHSIMIEDVPTEEQRQVVYQMMMEDIKAGYISHADVIQTIFTQNLKQMAIILAYKVDKGKQQQQAAALANTNNTAQAQIQSSQAAEANKLAADKERHLMKMAEIDLLQAWNWLIQQEKNKVQDKAALLKAHTEIATTDMDNQAAAGQNGQAPGATEPPTPAGGDPNTPNGQMGIIGMNQPQQ